MPGDLAEEGVNQIGYHESDDVAPAGDQGASGEVGPVVDFTHPPENALAGHFEDATHLF